VCFVLNYERWCRHHYRIEGSIVENDVDSLCEAGEVEQLQRYCRQSGFGTLDVDRKFAVDQMLSPEASKTFQQKVPEVPEHKSSIEDACRHMAHRSWRQSRNGSNDAASFREAYDTRMRDDFLLIRICAAAKQEWWSLRGRKTDPANDDSTLVHRHNGVTQSDRQRIEPFGMSNSSFAADVPELGVKTDGSECRGKRSGFGAAAQIGAPLT
jgi:hypothetical protein